MKALKNVSIGFIVAFLGSIPPGYLNLVGVDVFFKRGISSLVYYLLGIIVIEAFVVYFTVIFVNELVNNKKLMRAIDFFAVFFFFLLAYLFYSNSNQAAQEDSYLDVTVHDSPFYVGMILCGFNFLQIPFWMGWNLYLTNAKSISLVHNLKFHYILGILVGTFLGMLVAIVLLDFLSQITLSFSKYLVPIIIPLFFMALATYQAYKVYHKYFSIKSS